MGVEMYTTTVQKLFIEEKEVFKYAKKENGTFR